MPGAVSVADTCPVFHKNSTQHQLKLFLPFLQPFFNPKLDFFFFFFAGKGDWKHQSAGKGEEVLQLLTFQVKLGKHRGNSQLGQWEKSVNFQDKAAGSQ